MAIESPPNTGTHTANASPSSRTGRVQWRDEESESYGGYQPNRDSSDSLDQHMKGQGVGEGREGGGGRMQRPGSQTRPDTMERLDQAMYTADMSLAPAPGYGIEDNLYPNKEYVSPFEPKLYQAYRWPNRLEYLSLKQAGLYEVHIVLYASIICTYIHTI
jgi:hypothetical protein